jgi:hypothetical protein
MSKPRYAASVDANQKAIMRQLNQIPGVWAIAIGDPVDLLIGTRKRNFLVEIKLAGKAKHTTRKDIYTKKQRDFLRDWPGQVRVAETFDEIYKLITDAYKTLP